MPSGVDVATEDSDRPRRRLPSFAFCVEFVPVLGPILGAIPAILLAFADSPEKGVWALTAFVVIQQLEGNVLIPMLLRRTVEIPPALSLIGIAAH